MSNKISTAIIFLYYGFALHAQDTILLPHMLSIYSLLPTTSNALNEKAIDSWYLPPPILSVDNTDITIINSSGTIQSENSVYISPLNTNVLLNSNNSADWPITQTYGTSKFYSNNGGNTWSGNQFAPVGTNKGDPAVVINRNNRYFIGYINSSGGQSVAYSDNGGLNWTEVQIVPNPGSLADKNHLWVDNRQFKLDGTSNPYYGYIYSAWTHFVTSDILTT